MTPDTNRRSGVGRVQPATWFALATIALTAAAWLETWLARWPGRGPLDHPMFERLFAFYDNWGAVLAIAIVVLVWCSPALRRWGQQLARAMGEQPLPTALITFVILAFGARFAYHAHALAMDESAPLAQAYAFAQGRLSWTLPPELLDRMIPEGFRGSFLAVDRLSGETASMYWPGFAALLTPFAWAGVPWLLNPLLTAATLLLIHALALRIIGSREAAGWALLFTLGSPVIAANGISFYSMPAHLAANLLYALLLLDARPRRAFAAGLVGGLALVLHNPVPHLLFAVPWGVWLVLDRSRWPALGALLAGYLPGIAVTAAWPAFVDHIAPVAATSPHESLRELAAVKLGQALALPQYQTVLYRLAGTWKLWLWSVPGLLILAFAGARRMDGPLARLAACALLTYAGYWLVPVDQGHGWGYRYMHSGWAALPLLAAALMVAEPASSASGRAWRAWAGGLAVASLVLANTLRLVQVESVLSEHLAQLMPAPATGHWVRFVTPRRGLYSWDIIQNVPGRDQVLTLMSFGAGSDRQLMAERFPAAVPVVADGRGSLWRLE